MNETIITRLAGFVADARYDDLPEEMAEKARLHILDTFGAALAGATSEEAIRTRTALGHLDGPGQAQLWGTDMRLPPRGAAMVNGIAAHIHRGLPRGGSGIRQQRKPSRRPGGTTTRKAPRHSQALPATTPPITNPRALPTGMAA